jgi:hypothetical protein
MTTTRIPPQTRRAPLRRRRVRRASIASMALLTALLSSALPLHGLAILVVLAVAGLDILLIRGTEGLAFRRRHHLDERQLWLRDLAHRRGFRWVGLIALVLAVIAYASAAPSNAGGLGTWVDSGVTGRFVIAAAEVLLMVPTALIAWIEPDVPISEADVARRSAKGWPLWLVIPGLAAAWVATFVWAPPQTAPPGSFSAGGGGPSGSTCQEFAGGAIIGAEFGATVGMRADVCWNGKEAFVWGNPSLPLPADEVAQAEREIAAAYPPGAAPPLNLIDPAMPVMSGCGIDNVSDFAEVSDLTCTERIDGAGTLHYAVHATVAPLPFSIVSRHVTVELLVSRDGKVLRRP